MNITLPALLRTSLVVAALTALGGCGLKGPLVLEQVPVEQTQAPFEDSIDQLPVETPAVESAEQDDNATDAATSE